MLGPYLYVYKGFFVIFFVLQKYNYNSEKFPKKAFSQKKKLPNERKYKNCCEAKNMHKGHISGCRKNIIQKKSKLKVWHSYRIIA